MDNGPGWLPDPEHEDQERYWDGEGWTDMVRPTAPAGRLHLPEHVPELQRALAAATADIDEVEDRLSSLFDRTGSPAGAGSVRRTAPPPPPAAADDDDDLIDVGQDDVDSYEDQDEDQELDALFDEDDEPQLHEEFRVPVSRDDDAEDDSLADLDAALAAEAPDEPDRRLFRRRS